MARTPKAQARCGTDSNYLRFENSFTGVQTNLVQDSAGNFIFNNHHNNVYFHSLNTTYFRIGGSNVASPTTAAALTLGAAALPFSSAYIGGAATNNIRSSGTVTAALWVGAESSLGTASAHNFHFFTNNVDQLFLTTAGNLGLGTSTFGTSAAKVWGFFNGTAPGTSPADTVQLYANDIAAGPSALHIRDEGGSVYKIGGGALALPEAANLSVGTTTGTWKACIGSSSTKPQERCALETTNCRRGGAVRHQSGRCGRAD